MEPLSADDPSMVGEFALRARLGAGGMGQVYLASSPSGRAVAVKVVHPGLARDSEFRQRFSREVAAARAVSGMYTAPVVAAGLDDDPPWLATAFVPGPALADVVGGHGPLPEAAVWRLGAGLAEALRAVHACGLVHRDLKPANVLLAADGPHVIDFGISRAFEGTSLTSTGMVVGTPGYMSPEQAEGAVAGPESDVFSLGCVLAYAVTGAPPFGGGSAAAVLYRLVTAEPDLAGVPARLRQVIESCLQKNPAERIGLAQLTAVISAAGPAAPAALGSFWPEPVAALIAAGQAGTLAGPSLTGSAPAGPSPAGPSLAGPSLAGPSPAGPSPAPPGAAAAGYQPTATSLGVPPAAGAGGTGPAGTGQRGMVPDGYLSAATRGMAAGQPLAVSPLPAAPASPPGAPPPQPPSWPPPGGAPGAAYQAHQAPTWRQPAPALPTPPPVTPWPQGTAQEPQPGTPPPWSAAGQAAPHPLAQYAPGRRRPARAEIPAAILAATRLMYIGAAFSLLGVVLGRKAELRLADFSAAHAAPRVLAAANTLAVTTVLGGLIGIACWIVVAWACRRGRGWTRPVATTLLALNTAGMLATLLAARVDPAVRFTSVAIWLTGLAAVILLWGEQSRQFFSAWRGR